MGSSKHVGRGGDKSANVGSKVNEFDVQYEIVVERSAVPQGDVSLEDDDRFFQRRMELFPADAILPKDDTVEDNSWIARKFHKNTKENAPKQQVKEGTKKAEKRRAKFGKLDHPTVADQITQRAKQLEGNASQDMEGVEERQIVVAATQPARNYDELRERLSKKLAALANKRTSQKDHRKTGHIKIAQKSNKSVTKPKKEKDSKTDKEREEKEEKMLREKVAASITSGGSDGINLSFGGLVGTDEGAKEAETDPKKKKLGKRNLLNVKRMLKKAEENKALLDELKNSANLEDRKIAEEKQWDTIEQKARGEKVENPKSLRKVVKQIEKKKKKSAQAWDSRKTQEEEAKTAKYDKRDANIEKQQKKRVETKLRRKGIILEPEAGDEPKEKRKRKRPGFEGKHSGFLNNEDKKGSKNKGGTKKKKT
uniref:Ribosomal RNA-processing protein 14/surfeit locus protein 6 C-terminal domain-containing protein n=1 Tax=Mucochytrium quahogii TaxID=96639 RepID=A0A7S2R7N3_9STRA|mmetsp:Transcript_10881/g.23324  ORF Transcript_10881/g.23324 Transcript_10881/m.23324 type:complete len:424 (+) Transcript_10881:49-1320(+)